MKKSKREFNKGVMSFFFNEYDGTNVPKNERRNIKMQLFEFPATPSPGKYRRRGGREDKRLGEGREKRGGSLKERGETCDTRKLIK